MKRTRPDKRPPHLRRQLARDVPERLQLVHVVRDALQVAGVERVVRVQKSEHLLHESGKETVEGVREVQGLALVVELQVLEQLGEDVRVLLVEDAVRLQEHLVQIAARLVDQLGAETCRRRRNPR